MLLLRSDYNTYADTSDCLIFLLPLTPFTVAHVRYDLTSYLWRFLYDMIWRLDCAILYDINLGATHTTILSTRGVEIPISLVSSATDSIQ